MTKIAIRRRPLPVPESGAEKEKQLNISRVAGELIDLRNNWKDCRRCPLGERARKHVVLPDYYEFDGLNLKTDVLFIGEGPGESEDIIGKPFVGIAGILLRQAIEDADPFGLTVAFNNVVACRPQDRRAGQNRQPYPAEMEACSPRLEELIRIIDPVTIVAAGQVPRDNLPAMFFDFTEYYAGRLLSIAHPSYIARLGGKKSSQYPKYVAEITAVFNVARYEKEKRK